MPVKKTDGPTAFGAVVLEMMRARGVADASELGLDRLDLRALRRHFDGERATHRGRMPAHVADALEASPEEMTSMALAYVLGEKVVPDEVVTFADA